MSATYDLLVYAAYSPYAYRFGADDRLIRKMPHVGTTTYGVSFADNLVAVAHYGGGGLNVFDTSAATWTELPGAPNPNNEGAVCAFSPNGRYLAFASRAYAPYLSVYDKLNGWVPLLVEQPGKNIHGLAFKPDGSELAMTLNGADASGSLLRIMDTETWQMKSDIPAIPSGIGYRIAYSPEGKYLALTQQYSPYVRVYDTETWSQLTLGGTLSYTGQGVSFSGDGKYLAVAQSGAPGVIVFNTRDWSVADFPALPAALRVAFSGEGEILAVGLNTSPYLKVYASGSWEEQTFAGVSMIFSAPTCVEFSDPLLASLHGEIRDINGDPAARTVRAYRRSDGALVATALSDAATGAYSMRLVATQIPYDVQALAAEGEQLNDLFYARVTPE